VAARLDAWRDATPLAVPRARLRVHG